MAVPDFTTAMFPLSRPLNAEIAVDDAPSVPFSLKFRIEAEPEFVTVPVEATAAPPVPPLAVAVAFTLSTKVVALVMDPMFVPAGMFGPEMPMPGTKPAVLVTVAVALAFVVARLARTITPPPSPPMVRLCPATSKVPLSIGLIRICPPLGRLACPATERVPSLIWSTRSPVPTFVGAITLPVPLRRRLPGPDFVRFVARMALEIVGVDVVPSET